MIWIVCAGVLNPDPQQRLRWLLIDRTAWQWLTASALSEGHIFQLFALKSASGVVVATLASLEVYFTALLGMFLIGTRRLRTAGIWLPAGVAVVGTALLVW